jgi:putative FmdB family regulatory protein
MPTYEYECTKCGHKFEALQKITDKPLDKCPKCADKVRRLISSGVGIIFKGSGFYATDYRKKPTPQDVADSPRTMAKKSKEAQKVNTCPQAKEGCNACQQE